MKIRSREINVFSMSALDLFASALGAFILIAIVLMPYFLRSEISEAELRTALEEAQAAKNELQASLEQEQNALRECQMREMSCQQELESARQGIEGLQSCHAELNACEEKLSKTFLAVVIQWTTKHDVDLHIVDPAGEEFSYSQTTIVGRPGELSADTTNGPGVEIWEVTEAPAGKYRVLYNLYRIDSDDVPAAVVKGGVYYRDGHFRFNERRLTRVGRDNAEVVVEITVGDDGGVEISER